MAWTRDDVLAVTRARFAGRARSRVLRLLDSYGVAPYEREVARVQLAILKLSEGSESKVQEFVAVAKRDYRDVLFWAEYPDQAKVDTPEKRREIRELFAKLGIEPPQNLLD